MLCMGLLGVVVQGLFRWLFRYLPVGLWSIAVEWVGFQCWCWGGCGGGGGGGDIVKCSSAESLARNGAMAIWMALERRDSMLAGAAVLVGAVGCVGIMGLGELIAVIGHARGFFGQGVGDGSVALVVLGVTGALGLPLGVMGGVVVFCTAQSGLVLHGVKGAAGASTVTGASLGG